MGIRSDAERSTSFLVSTAGKAHFPNIDDECGRAVTAQFLSARRIVAAESPPGLAVRHEGATVDSRNKKRVTTGLGITAAAAAALAITAGTFAAFNDVEGGATQSITAGTLDLVPGGSAVTSPIDTVNARPSNSGTGYKRLDLTNSGSLPGTLSLNVVKTADLENGCDEPEVVDEPNCAADDNGELGEKLIVVILDSNQSTYLGSRVLNSWAGNTIDLGQLAGGATKTVYISTQVDPSAGNRVQSDKASFVVNAALAQLP